MKLRLGAVSYLNVEPLIYGLDHDQRFSVESDVPSRIADRLRAGDIDLGMIPSIEYAGGDYWIVPGVGIASEGAVRSVLLFHRGRLDEVKRVAVDTSSRTSIALLRVLLAERLGREPEYLPHPPDLDEMLGVADAALLIGDAALYAEIDLTPVDLGTAWTDATTLPFVWAFWAGRAGLVDARDVGRLQRALDEGLQAIPRIASTYNDREGRSHEDLNETYLRSHIVFRVGDRERAGLEEFYRRAHRLRLLENVPALRFYEHP